MLAIREGRLETSPRAGIDGAPSTASRPEARPRPAAEHEPACALCGAAWRELGHCKGVCLSCGYMQSCVDTL